MKIHSNRHSPFCILALLLLGGCAGPTVMTTLSPADANSKTFWKNTPANLVQGNYYYLPRGIVHLEGSVPKGEVNFQVTMSAKMVPDVEGGRYFLSYSSAALYDDHVVIGVDEKGLLTSSSGKSKDETVQVISDTIKTIGQVDNFLHAMANVDVGIPPKKVEFKDFVYDFDPYAPDAESVANKFLNSKGVKVAFKLSLPAKGTELEQLAELKYKGVIFRPMWAMDITVTSNDEEHTHIWKGSVAVPDCNNPLVFDMSRVPFITSEKNLKFTNGVLTEATIDRPSVVLAVIGVPKTIVEAVIPFLGSMTGAAAPSASKN